MDLLYSGHLYQSTISGKMNIFGNIIHFNNIVSGRIIGSGSEGKEFKWLGINHYCVGGKKKINYSLENELCSSLSTFSLINPCFEINKQP